MPRNGSGVYSPPAANYPAVSGTTITAANRNGVDADIATALTNSIAVNGESVVTSNIPMSGNKLTGLGIATARTDAASLANIQDGTGVYSGTVGGTADVITITPSPAITAYTAGQLFSFIASGANTTNVTINVNGLGAKAIAKNGTTALAAGDIPSGALVGVRYDGTRFQLVSGGAATYADLTSVGTAMQKQTYNSFTTGGTSTAYTLTPTPALASLTTNHRFNVTFNATAGATPTLAISGLTAKLLKVYDTAGAKVAASSTTIVANLNSDVIYDGTDYVVLDPVVSTTASSKIQPITASVAANALTVTLNPTTLDFRSATIGSGTVTTINVSGAISVVVSSGSTLGTVSAVQNRLAVVAINNAGTVELAVVNLAGGTNLDETGVISTTAEGGAGAADSATVIYSTTARTNVAYRVVGYVESTQATAGTWATAPSTIQGYGGQAMAALSSIGYGQTWQNLTGSRASATTYYNTTGKPMEVAVTGGAGAASSGITVTVNGLVIFTNITNDGSVGSTIGGCFIVPAGNSYLVTTTGALSAWYELR
jgi:hypothetical protein